jgi:hypothetical protein
MLILTYVAGVFTGIVASAIGVWLFISRADGGSTL